MPRAVIDTTVLVSAFLRPHEGGASFDLLHLAAAGAFELVLSDDILEETARVLLTRPHLRRRYQYPDAAVVIYCKGLTEIATVVISDPPSVDVVRDPEDNMIVACAAIAKAEYLVSRDKDLLALGEYSGIRMLTPEAFLSVLRAA